MMDRLTVMGCLEGLAQDDCWEQWYSDSEVQETAKAALSLLKEQEARIEQLNRFMNGFSREAVPVVRCKDCKYGEKINQVHGDDVMYICNSSVFSSARCVHLHDAHWFCADGERKKGR